MRIDLFELIEGFFSGVIYFVYNVIATIGRLIRHPFRAPLRLFLRHRSRRKRQIGGLAALFLFYFLFMLSVDLLDFQGANAAEAGRTLFIADQFDSRPFWPSVLFALIATTITDAFLRLLLKLRLRSRPLRAEATLNAVEFAWLMPILGLGGIAICFPIFGSDDQPGFHVGVRAIASLIALTLVVLAPIPPLALLRSGLRYRQPRRQAGSIGRKARLFAGGAAIWSLIFVALLVGMLPRAIRMRESIMAAGVPDKAETVEVLDLECHLTGEQPYADALLSNSAGEPIMLRSREIEVVIRRLRGDRRERRFRARDEAAAPSLIQPGSTVLARFELRPNADFTPAAGATCSLYLRSSDADDRNIFSGGGFSRRDNIMAW